MSEAGQSELVDVHVLVHDRCDRAIFVSDDGDADSAVWLPLSQIDVSIDAGDCAVITMPEWLAIDRGLV